MRHFTDKYVVRLVLEGYKEKDSESVRSQQSVEQPYHCLSQPCDIYIRCLYVFKFVSRWIFIPMTPILVVDVSSY